VLLFVRRSSLLPAGKTGISPGRAHPFEGYLHLLERRFEEAITAFNRAQTEQGASDAVSSALAAAYHRLAFQTLADQVRRSVRSVRGNQWMFRVGHPIDQPLRVRPELDRTSADAPFPVLCERTPVRMDLTHSGWSDIFFLGMDFPEGARVLNVSIDLAVRGRDTAPRPPVEAYLRVLDEPVLRLASVDLGASADITSLHDVFDFAKDYLGLLKAALIASGLVPPGIEGSEQSLPSLLARLVGPGRGLELVSSVNNIPKGSRWPFRPTCWRPYRRLYARDRADKNAGRPAQRKRAAAGGGPRDIGRVAGRIGRRLAGQRRRVAGHQADRGATGRGRRPGIGRQPRAPAARPPHPGS
jgi:hypothetical protein